MSATAMKRLASTLCLAASVAATVATEARPSQRWTSPRAGAS